MKDTDDNVDKECGKKEHNHHPTTTKNHTDTWQGSRITNHMRTYRERHITQPYNHALIRRQHHTHARAHAPPVTQLTWYDDGSWLGQKLMMPKMGLSFWSS